MEKKIQKKEKKTPVRTKKTEKKEILKKSKISEVAPAKIYNQSGKEVGEIKLPETIFGLSWNADLVHQVVYSMLSDRRVPYAHTKDRGDVRGGGKKPWRQKGTGRARHGSNRSPIWVGGGVAHGPRNEKNFSRKINKKVKVKALYTILSKKLKDGEITFVDSFNIAKPKTTDAIAILKSISKIKTAEGLFLKRKNSAIIAISSKRPALEKSFSNIGNVMVDEVRNINPVDLLNKKYLVIENPEESVKFLVSKMTKTK
jgi:large subunit ribosomal protein L4